ncbi:hypothetical protein RJ639_046726 [Escallonia herrerae]|uniref:Solute carrier family 40 member n=1 Tax=Escallonia herrerae TaxID=1293975 RepID=A0AA88WB54_9ASTE|nr:hypothetical protein RJ639_046726 [Escallonia herrerae]
MASLILTQPPATCFALLRQVHSPSSPRSSRLRRNFSSSRWLNLHSDIQRLDRFRSRCSISKEALNLLSEGTYVDTLLTTLPVLSEEEQNVISATPAHPAGLFGKNHFMHKSLHNHMYAKYTEYMVTTFLAQSFASPEQEFFFVILSTLYASCLAGNLVEQLWNFAWPAAIALIHPSLLPVAVMGFCTKLAIIIGGPLIGKLMDHFPRVPAYNYLTSVQLLSVGMIIHAHTCHSTLASSLLRRPWFVILVLAGAVERLSGLALGVAMERDWVVLLAGTNRPLALAQANAVLSRIDLLCEIAGASLFGVLLSKYETVTCLKIAAGLMIWALPVVVGLTWLTNKLSSGVLDRAKSSQTCSRSTCGGPQPAIGNIVEMSVGAIKHGWVEYLQQPVLPASLAYVLLYFNVVLAPSGLMTAFLTQHGLNPSIIGGFSGLCAFMGVAATFVSADMVKRYGILKAGAAGLILQASLLTIAVAVYWSGSLSQRTPLILFLCLIVLSRLGHMSYDVVGAQILQAGIPASKANLIGTTEVSFASLAESVMLGVAIIANDVSHFGFLAVLSLLSVVAASWLFCQWLRSPTDAQRSLFSFDTQF